MPYLQCSGCEEFPPFQLFWEPVSRPSASPPVQPNPTNLTINNQPPLTQAEEVWELVQEFYKGAPIPPDEQSACLDAIEKERNPPPIKDQEPERPKTLEEALGPKPSWGDPLFWDYWRRAKALGFTKKTK